MNPDNLVDAETLRDVLFVKLGRKPSLSTIRAWQYAGIIPSLKIGHFVFFNPDEVWAHWERRNKKRARN